MAPQSLIMPGLKEERKPCFSQEPTCGFPLKKGSEGKVPTGPPPACISPDLPSEGPVRHFVAVLCSHSNLGVQLLPGKVDVGGGGCTNHFWRVAMMAQGNEVTRKPLSRLHPVFWRALAFTLFLSSAFQPFSLQQDHLCPLPNPAGPYPTP